MKNALKPPSDIIRKKDVACMLGICEGTLVNWVNRGTFPDPTRIHGNWYFDRKMVEDWKAKQFSRQSAA